MRYICKPQRRAGRFLTAVALLGTLLSSQLRAESSGGFTGGGGFAYVVNYQEYRFVDSEEVLKTYHRLIRASGWTRSERFWDWAMGGFKVLLNFGEVDDIREALFDSIAQKQPRLAAELRTQFRQLRWAKIAKPSKLKLEFKEPRPRGTALGSEGGVFLQSYRNKRIALQDRRQKIVHLLPEAERFRNFERAILQVHEAYVASPRYEKNPATFAVISKLIADSIDYVIPMILQRSHRRLGEPKFKEALASVYLDIFLSEKSWRGTLLPPSASSTLEDAFRTRWPLSRYENQTHYDFIANVDRQHQSELGHYDDTPEREVMFKTSYVHANYFLNFAFMLSPDCRRQNERSILNWGNRRGGFSYIAGLRAYSTLELIQKMLENHVMLQVRLANSPLLGSEGTPPNSAKFSFRKKLIEEYIQPECFQ